MTKEQEMARLVELDRLYFDEGAISRQEYLKEVKAIEQANKGTNLK